MKKHTSIKYLLFHLFCFIFGAGAIYNAYNMYSFLSEYNQAEYNYVDSYDFHKSYMKYIERLTFYIHYTESGYTADLSSLNNLEDILRTETETEMHVMVAPNEDDQTNYEFYNYCLNIQDTNFVYIVENTVTGQYYYSPSLQAGYPDSVVDFTKNIEDNPAYFILNTKTGKYTTNVNQDYGILTRSDLSWMMTTLSEPIINSKTEEGTSYTYIIYTGINPDFSATGDVFHADHNRFIVLKKYYNYSLYLLPASLLLGFITLSMLLAETGHHKRGNMTDSQNNGIYLTGFDKIYTEIGALCILAILFLEALFPLDYFRTLTLSGYDSVIVLEFLYCIVYPVAISGLLSLVRRIKAGTLWHNSILYRVGCYVIRKGRSFFQHHNITYRIASFLLVFLCIQLFGIFLYLNTFNKLLLIGIFILSYLYLFVYLIRLAIDLGVILEGAKLMQEGDMNIKLPVAELTPAIQELGEYINNISSGLWVAVEERTKSERFKAELITNVSHDIKTPLTSIINYVDLLKKEPIDNPKVQEYLGILDNKSWRLKTLIEDLVEASKASSGAIKINPQKINFVELMKQAAGEFDDRFHENQLELVISSHTPVVSIFADGRSTYRVIDNLLSNVNKYAMHGTRVYVDLYREQEFGVLTIKNISKNRLNITPDELMERFVRGDASRNTEGSGLGLSISRSLTTLQNGLFNLEVDGDLFKVIVQLPLYIEPLKE